MKKYLLPTICSLLVVLVVHAAVWPPEPMTRTHIPFGKGLGRRAGYMNYIEKVKPDVVLLGNSMLGEGVDGAMFQQLTRKRTAKVVNGGAASAWWYLMMKNVLTKTQYTPPVTVIFFRDHYLTVPDFRVNGEYYVELIDAVCEPEEPLLDRLAYLGNMDGMTYCFNQISPVYQKRWAFKSGVDAFVKGSLAGEQCGMSEKVVDEAIGRVFADENLNSELLTRRQLAAESDTMVSNYDFEAKCANSFLPPIIELAKASQMKLVFVRVKRRRDVVPHSEPEHVKKYVQNLQAYLTANGCEFVDFTHDERITIDWFGEGDHLSRAKGQPQFTRILAERLLPIINAAK